MNTMTETQVRVGRTPDIELFRLGKSAFIEIGCSHPDYYYLSGFDLVSREHCVMASCAPCVHPGKVITQRLLNGSWYQRWIIAQGLVDLWVLTKTLEDKGQKARGGGIACCHYL